jgi:proline utilization trans-activator
MEAPASKKAKRRVPDTQRQRVSVSCDRCKIRKIRCIRPSGSNDGDCAACAQLNLACEATLPRKQRVYASYDQLQLRYRLLDGLVKKLFPGENVETVEGILDLANRQGIELAGSYEENGLLDPIDGGGRGEGSTVAQSGNGTLKVESSEFSLFDSVQHLHIPEGELIPAPRGAYHYVGPASSYLFANTVRELVKKASINTLAFDRSGYRRQQRANEFTSSDRTTALEARIQGHPINIAEEDESSEHGQGDDGTPVCPSDGGVGISPQDRPTPRSIPRSITRHTVDLLPPRGIADRLVSAFFDRVHTNFPLFHRGTFQIRYEALWPTARSSHAPGFDTDTGWLCVLYMVFVLGAQALERDTLKEATAIQGRYLAIVVREGLQRLVLTATMANVQALALLSLYQHNAGERNTAWMLMGHASRMAVALGMQRDGENGNFDFIIRNLRRTIWWTLFLFEQNLSFILGRPSATSTLDISASLPDEAASDGTRDAPPGYLEYAVKLGVISAKIKRFTAANSTKYDKPDGATTRSCFTAVEIRSTCTPSTWHSIRYEQASSCYPASCRQFLSSKIRSRATISSLSCRPRPGHAIHRLWISTVPESLSSRNLESR